MYSKIDDIAKILKDISTCDKSASVSLKPQEDHFSSESVPTRINVASQCDNDISLDNRTYEDLSGSEFVCQLKFPDLDSFIIHDSYPFKCHDCCSCFPI